jgi:hypothetical protein
MDLSELRTFIMDLLSAPAKLPACPLNVERPLAIPGSGEVLTVQQA